MKRQEKETNIPWKNAKKKEIKNFSPKIKEITNKIQNTNAHKK